MTSISTLWVGHLEFPAREPIVHGNDIVRVWHAEDEEQESKSRNYVGMKLVERLCEKVAECNENQDSSESQQSWTSPPSSQEQSPRGEFDHWHYGPCCPQ